MIDHANMARIEGRINRLVASGKVAKKVSSPKLLSFKVNPARGESFTVDAPNFAAAAATIQRDGRRNLFGIERGRAARFYLDRGKGPLYPISVRAAANELGMGGF